MQVGPNSTVVFLCDTFLGVHTNVVYYQFPAADLLLPSEEMNPSSTLCSATLPPCATARLMPTQNAFLCLPDHNQTVLCEHAKMKRLTSISMSINFHQSEWNTR